MLVSVSPHQNPTHGEVTFISSVEAGGPASLPLSGPSTPTCQMESHIKDLQLQGLPGPRILLLRFLGGGDPFLGASRQYWDTKTQPPCLRLEQFQRAFLAPELSVGSEAFVRTLLFPILPLPTSAFLL